MTRVMGRGMMCMSVLDGVFVPTEGTSYRIKSISRAPGNPPPTRPNSEQDDHASPSPSPLALDLDHGASEPTPRKGKCTLNGKKKKTKKKNQKRGSSD